MNLLVCLSITPETTAKIAFQENNTVFDTSGVQFIANPYDEWFALVRAVELKEQVGGTVTLLNIGPAGNDMLLRKAFAVGADALVRIDAQPSSAFFVATQIANYAQDKNFDVFFLGKETIDYNGAEVGGMLAEMLDLPFISFANHLEMKDSVATITRDIEGGVEVCEVSTPFVLSASKGLATQRIPNIRSVMMANRTQIKVLPAIPVTAPTVAVTFGLPSKKEGVKMIDADDVATLVRLLREEEKVI